TRPSRCRTCSTCSRRGCASRDRLAARIGRRAKMDYKPGDLTKSVARGARRKVFEEVGKHKNWWEFPLPAQLAALALFREDLREFNLYDTEAPENGGATAVTNEPPPPYRTYDGSHTDPDNPAMGRSGMRFGRNMPPEMTVPQEQSML